MGSSSLLLLCSLWLSLFGLTAVAFAPVPTKIARQSRLPALFAAQRNIVVLSHNVSSKVVNGCFDINNLLSGRVDVLTRCVNSALWVSNGIREDTNVFLMFFPQNITIEVQGANVRGLNPDERTMALSLQQTFLSGSNVTQEALYHEELRVLQETKRERPIEINRFKPGALPKSEKNRLRKIRKSREAAVRRLKKVDGDPPAGFVFHANDSLEDRIQQFAAGGPVLMLTEDGASLETVVPATDEENLTLIFGNQLGYAAADESLMKEKNLLEVSIGPVSLLTSQCIILMHHYMDCL